MRYVEARYLAQRRQEIYRIYVTEALYALGHGQGLTGHYFELVDDTPPDDRTEDEIINHMKDRLNAIGGAEHDSA